VGLEQQVGQVLRVLADQLVARVSLDLLEHQEHLDHLARPVRLGPLALQGLLEQQVRCTFIRLNVVSTGFDSKHSCKT